MFGGGGGICHSCCILEVIKCFIFNRIVLGSSFIHQVICYLTVLNFCEMNRVLLEGIFKGFAFQKVFWGLSVSCKVFFVLQKHPELC